MILLLDDSIRPWFLKYLRFRMKLTHCQIFEKTNMFLGMPIKRIYHFVPVTKLQKLIDRFYYFFRFLPILAFSKR